MTSSSLSTRPGPTRAGAAVGLLLAAGCVLVGGTSLTLGAASAQAAPTDPLTSGLAAGEVLAWAASYAWSAAPWFALVALVVATGPSPRTTAAVGGAALAAWTAAALVPAHAPLLAWPGLARDVGARRRA